MRLSLPSLPALSAGRLLVAETDGLTLRAAIVRRRGQHLAIEHVARSMRADPNAALGEVLAQLRPHRLPRRAVLLTSEVVAALVSLPVSPKHPRPAVEMQELVRWELEPQVALNVGTRPIGEVLVGRGALTYEQVQQVLDEMEIRRQSAMLVPGRPPVERFGETAVSLGMVCYDQVEEALAIQQRFQHPPDDLICGWQAQGDEPGADGQYRWLVCGMSRQVRDECEQAFSAQGLELEAIYPQASASAATLNNEAQVGTSAVLEIQPGAITLSRIRQGRLESLQSQLTAGRRPTAQLCRDLIGATPIDRLWGAGPYPDWPELAVELHRLLRVEPRPAPVVHAGEVGGPWSTGEWSALAGASRHAFRLPGSRTTVRLSAADPRPPSWRQPRALATVATGMVVALLAAVEWNLQAKLKSAEQQYASAAQATAQLQAQAAAAKSLADTADELSAEIDAKRTELRALTRQTAVLSELAPRRTRFLPALLDALARASSEEVVVDRIAETANQHFEISAWALNERAAARFSQLLADTVADWHMTVTTDSVWEQTGRLGLPGYTMTIQLGEVHLSNQPTELSGAPQETH